MSSPVQMCARTWQGPTMRLQMACPSCGTHLLASWCQPMQAPGRQQMRPVNSTSSPSSSPSASSTAARTASLAATCGMEAGGETRHCWRGRHSRGSGTIVVDVLRLACWRAGRNRQAARAGAVHDAHQRDERRGQRRGNLENRGRAHALAVAHHRQAASQEQQLLAGLLAAGAKGMIK